MEKIFDGQCKDCEFGRLQEDQRPNYIACQLGGIREPNQTCNLTLSPVEDLELDYEEVILEHLKWIATEQGRVADPDQRDNGDAYQTLARASNNLAGLWRKAKHTPQAGVKKEEA